MKYCHNCGAQLEDPARFCTRCGTPALDTTKAAPPQAAPVPAQQPPAPATAAQAEAPQAPAAPADVARTAPAPAQQPPIPPVRPASAAAQTPAPAAPQKQRWGIAAQFPAIAAGQRPHASILTYFYGFYQLLYHKSYRLFCRTYLPCCLLFVLAIGLLSYATIATPTPDLAMGASLLFLLAAAVWIVAVSIWLSRHYAQELYKQVQGDADRIPASILPPILGGIALVALSVLAFVIGLAASSLHSAAPEPTIPQSAVSEPAPEEEPLPAEEAPAAETPAPTEESTPVEETAPAQEPAENNEAPAASNDYCWLVMENEPWKGAWSTPDGTELFIFENTMNEQDSAVTNADGSITIYRADARDGTVYSIYTLSSDQTTLTEQDTDANPLATYCRPTYDMASSPIPSAYWGAYTMVGDYSISTVAPQGEQNPLGPTDDFVIDAFRFGNAPYSRLVDYGDGTWSAYFSIPPEGGETTFGFPSVGEDQYLDIYYPDGRLRYRYLRTATVQ